MTFPKEKSPLDFIEFDYNLLIRDIERFIRLNHLKKYRFYQMCGLGGSTHYRISHDRMPPHATQLMKICTILGTDPRKYFRVMTGDFRERQAFAAFIKKFTREEQDGKQAQHSDH